MQTKKTKLAIAIGSIGLFMGAAQLAHAGIVEVDVGTYVNGKKLPTFSTDISGPGSDNQPFFAPDVRWTPGENIGANASVRFNLGGKDGDPARFATNAIDVNNFVLVARNNIANAWTTAPTGANTTISGGAGVVTASETLAVLTAAGNVSTTASVAQLQTAINAGMAAATNFAPVGAKVVDNLTADERAAFIAAVDGAAGITAGTGEAVVTALIAAADAAVATDHTFASTAVRVGPGSYTNGNSTTWFKADGSPFGRIFLNATAGGVGSFDVTVNVAVPLVGDANGKTGGLNGDSILLSLNSGKYVLNDGTPATFAQGTLNDTNVDITNLKAQGFDGLPVEGYARAGEIDIMVSVQQGGVTVDTRNGRNNTLFAASANPLQFAGFAGLNGQTASAAFPTTINLAAEEKLFTRHPTPYVSPSWYSNDLTAPAQSLAYNHLGSFRFGIADLPPSLGKKYNEFDTLQPDSWTGFTQVSDPIGNPYALTAGDTISLSFNPKGAVEGAFAPISSLFLRSANNGDCTAAAGNGDIALSVNAAEGTASHNNAALVSGTVYTVCAHVNKTTEITPFQLQVTAALQNVEPTYRDPSFPATDLGAWVRNGCDATFFNVPGNGPAATGVDKGFLRFTNTTNASTGGTVRAKVWGQGGKPLGSGKLLATTGTAGQNVT